QPEVPDLPGAVHGPGRASGAPGEAPPRPAAPGLLGERDDRTAGCVLPWTVGGRLPGLFLGVPGGPGVRPPGVPVAVPGGPGGRPPGVTRLGHRALPSMIMLSTAASSRSRASAVCTIRPSR